MQESKRAAGVRDYNYFLEILFVTRTVVRSQLGLLKVMTSSGWSTRQHNWLTYMGGVAPVANRHGLDLTKCRQGSVFNWPSLNVTVAKSESTADTFALLELASPLLPRLSAVFPPSSPLPSSALAAGPASPSPKLPKEAASTETPRINRTLNEIILCLFIFLMMSAYSGAYLRDSRQQ